MFSRSIKIGWNRTRQDIVFFNFKNGSMEMYWRKWLHIELLFHITILQHIDQTNSVRLLTSTPSLLRLPDGLTAQQVEKGPVSGSRGSWENQNSGRAKEERAHSRKTIKLKSVFLALWLLSFSLRSPAFPILHRLVENINGIAWVIGPNLVRVFFTGFIFECNGLSCI